MIDFSPAFVATVVQEFLGPFIWLVALLAITCVLSLAALVVMRSSTDTRWPGRVSVMLAIVAAVIALIAAPALTDAGFGSIRGAIDVAALVLVSLAAGIGTLIFLCPVLRVTARLLQH